MQENIKQNILALIVKQVGQNTEISNGVTVIILFISLIHSCVFCASPLQKHSDFRRAVKAYTYF